jgi:hypothetical protein
MSKWRKDWEKQTQKTKERVCQVQIHSLSNCRPDCAGGQVLVRMCTLLGNRSVAFTGVSLKDVPPKY